MTFGKYIILWFFYGFILSSLALVNAAPTPSPVQRYFEGLESLEADFVQQVFDENARLLEESSGRMYMRKPGQFRWDYKEPTDQLIVADGKRLWLYDKELEQVTVRKLDQALSTTPLALLSGAAPLEDAFNINDAGKQNGLHWYELRPKKQQSEFELVRIAFRGDALSSIELEDAFNQRTRLSFEALQRNIPIDAELLQFTPPPGVDVVGDAP
jgi:outer membrane lipoprotein carrier protein